MAHAAQQLPEIRPRKRGVASRVISFRVWPSDVAIVKALHEYCERSNYTSSSVILTAVSEYLQRQKGKP